MAVGWMSVLKMVPWGEVIDNAPKVAHGARKLWSAVGQKPAAAPQPADAQASPLAVVQAQLAELQARSAELHQQMLESSALIESLAEQNTELIRQLDINRRRLLWLAGACLVMAALFGFHWLRHA